jgi:tetratricopeptide (TPR) repeat protein
VEYYSKALEINPNDVAVWTIKGLTLCLLKRYEEAIGCCDKALEIDPNDADAWNNKGTALYNLKRYEDAIRCYDKALKIDPDLEDAKTNRKIAEEKLQATKPIPKVVPPTPTTPISHLSIERTIYDPTKRNFTISTPRPLPNVKDWIDRNDPSMYWFVTCINNNSDRPIDEWGIELEVPSTVRIMESRIEGIEQRFNLTESVTKPWLKNYILGVPHHL